MDPYGYAMHAHDFPYFAPFVAFAHRGGDAAGLAVENSVAAFSAALEMGYTHLETDVHTTSDGVLIALHDGVLDRVTDAAGSVADMPWSEVSQARIGGREPIPTMDELLETFPDARFNIDIKAAGAVQPLADSLRRHQAQRRVCVGSFSQHRLDSFRALAGQRVATAAGPLEVSNYLTPGLRGLGMHAASALQIPITAGNTPIKILTPGLISAAHRHGLAVHVWTVNDAATMHDVLDAGVDGIFSDSLTTLQDVAVERGIWPTR